MYLKVSTNGIPKELIPDLYLLDTNSAKALAIPPKNMAAFKKHDNLRANQG